MIDTLPDNVELLENTQLMNGIKNKDSINCKFKNKINYKKNYLLYKWFFKIIGIKKNYNFPLNFNSKHDKTIN